MVKSVENIKINAAKMEKDIEHIRTTQGDFKVSQNELRMEIKNSKVETDQKLDKIISSIEKLNHEIIQHVQTETIIIDKRFEDKDKENRANFADKKVEIGAYWVIGVVMFIIISAIVYNLLK